MSNYITTPLGVCCRGLAATSHTPNTFHLCGPETRPSSFTGYWSGITSHDQRPNGLVLLAIVWLLSEYWFDLILEKFLEEQEKSC